MNKTFIATPGIDEQIESNILKDIEMKILNANKKDLEFDKNENIDEVKLSSNFKKSEYINAIEKVRDYIKQGDIYQANLTQRFSGKTNLSSYQLYKRLRDVSKAPFAAFLNVFEKGFTGENGRTYSKSTGIGLYVPTAKPIFHSDRGFQYTSKIFKSKLDNISATQSMSRVGRCIDNGPMEGFWGSLKSEMYYLKKFQTFDELKLAIDNYIDFYNNKRLQKKLKGLSPMEYREQTLVA
ncbi:hypothetical protein D4A35_01430 [Paraclostridium bifermentans]|uniref:Integrase catalytic domain-containing protein n=1 Tax=Paraclostridium bifermentans TaxID=1490 RepID=A0A5P3XDC7_PARBF|nr:hypothetical protein D4A35_01430 [Paraclostridium bifermentans]